MSDAGLPRIPVRCPRCQGRLPPDVLDGPGVVIAVVRLEDATGGDLCQPCPSCGLEVCVRVLQRAA